MRCGELLVRRSSGNSFGRIVLTDFRYDMDFSGPFWSFFSFARSVGGVANGYPLTEKGGDDEEEES